MTSQCFFLAETGESPSASPTFWVVLRAGKSGKKCGRGHEWHPPTQRRSSADHLGEKGESDDQKRWFTPTASPVLELPLTLLVVGLSKPKKARLVGSVVNAPDKPLRDTPKFTLVRLEKA